MSDLAWISGTEAAEILGVSRQRVYQIAHWGGGTPYPIRAKRLKTRGERPAWRYSREDVLARRDAAQPTHYVQTGDDPGWVGRTFFPWRKFGETPTGRTIDK